jgi:hypothetical protein
MKRIIAVLLTTSLYIISFPVLAHDIDLETPASEPPELLPDSIELEANNLQPAQSVVDQYKLWEAGQTLRVCFFSGDQEAREFFVQTAIIWDDIVSANFDFGSQPKYNNCGDGGTYHIRVALDSSGGNWSYIGTDATLVAQTKPTLHISTASPFSLNTKRALGGTILHELGHALALAHEHQSPDSNCEAELNWTVVYDQMSQPPNRWSKEKVDQNLRRLVSSPRYRSSEYDPKSIMHYALPAPWFTNGTRSACYITKNTNLSDLDRVYAQKAYPATPQAQDAYLEAVDKLSAVSIASSGLSESEVLLIETLIDRILTAVPGRSLESQLASEVTNVNAMTTGNCSPIITKAGDVVLNCSPSP